MKKTMETQHEERVALGCLSCYNEGRLTYKWLNAEQLEEAWQSGNMAKYVCDRPDDGYHIRDEWEIQDYDGEISRLRLGGWPNIENLISMMMLMDEDPSKYVPAYLAACDRYDNPTAEQVEEVADMMIYINQCSGNMFTDSVQEYFMQQAYELGDIKNGDPMELYIDWERYARDLMYDYSRFEYDGDTYLLPNY
jgi:antirestriction protein